MKKTNKVSGASSIRGLLPTLISVFVLTACSGGGDEPKDPLEEIPTVQIGGVSGSDGEGSSSDGESSSGASSDGTSSGVSDATATSDGGSTDSGATDGGSGGQVTEDPKLVVETPEDRQIPISEVLDLAGSVTINAIPESTPVILWSMQSGPGNAIFTDSSKANTSVSFDSVGVYVLELQAENGEHLSSDQMQVTVDAVVVNQAPVVDAGTDTSITINEVLNLSATMGDDGLPDGTLSGEWKKISGPGVATFGETSQQNTTITFSAIGDYTIGFTVSDGELNTTGEFDVEVAIAPEVSNPEDNVNAANVWQEVITADGSTSQPRHEAAAVAYQDDFYIFGGRGLRQVDRYDPTTDSWENLGTPAIEMSHFQPVVYGDKLYVVGALSCCYPSEDIVTEIQIFDPVTKEWSVGASLPAGRERGAAGTVVRNNKIYLIGGSTNGHDGGMVAWFDEYNPATNQWKILPDAPTPRDHFSAALVGNKIIAAGGRQTDYPETFANLVTTVDIYDFATNKWTAGKPIPTTRAGAMVVSYGDEAILSGGEATMGSDSLGVVEAYNAKTNTWRTLNPLQVPRHSGGAAIVDGAIHVVAGNLQTGGGNETDSHEKLELQ